MTALLKEKYCERVINRFNEEKSNGINAQPQVNHVNM